MFKNIGIYVKEKTDEGIDSHGLDVLISSLNKHTSVSYTHLTLPTKA